MNPFALRNKECFYNLFFRCVNETLSSIAADPKYLGALPGMITVLHTWGQKLLDHPHIHCLVPGGGLDISNGVWKGVPNEGFLFPVKVLSTVFRGKFMEYFREAIDKGDILFHGALGCYHNDTTLLQNLLAKLYATDWVVYSKAPFAGPGAVVKYLGRYTHRIAISNQRIASLSDTEVSFHWKDYADENAEKVMTLSIEEFIRRFLLHVLPSGFVRIRYYGFMSQSSRKKLALCKELLGKPVTGNNEIVPRWAELIMALTGADPFTCPNCGNGRLKKMKQIEYSVVKKFKRRIA